MTVNSDQPIPFSQLSLLATKLENVDFRSNLFGIDITKYNPRRVINSFAARPIFEGLSPFSTDYKIQSFKIVKKGMSFNSTELSEGQNSVFMAYGYSKFSEQWGVNLGVSATKKNITAGVDVGYSQFTEQERSATNVYAYTLEQYFSYDITNYPKELKLDEAFIQAVTGVSSADKAKTFVDDYGTHYASRVIYGGERSLYATMDSTTYAEAKGFDINLKAKVSAGKPGGSSKPASGSLGFENSENQQEKQVLKNVRGGYISIGGNGGFDSWSADADNSVAVAVEMAPIVDLLVDEVMKGSVGIDILARSKRLIAAEVSKRMEKLQRLSEPLPAPRVYTIHLKRIEVIDEVDDLDNRTKGTITASLSPSIAGFNGSLWSAEHFDESNLSYKKGRFVLPNKKQTFVQYPTATGTFERQSVTISGEIHESDHAGGAERHTGSTSFTINPNLAVGEEQTIELDLRAYTTFAEKGTIRVTVSVRSEPSDFEEELSQFSRTVRRTTSTAPVRPQPVVETTFSPITNKPIKDFARWAPIGGVKVVSGDFTGDGRTDIALINQGDGWDTLPVAISNGDGAFTVTNHRVGRFNRWSTEADVRILTGDFNGNGRTDIALLKQSAGWGTIPIAFSEGDGQFEITNQSGGQLNGWMAMPGIHIVTGDFNGNGLTDIALINQSSGWDTLPVGFSQGNGQFSVTNQNVGQFNRWSAYAGIKAVTGDFNGNGRTDIALINQGDGWGTLPVAFSQGNGQFNVTNHNSAEFNKWAATPGVHVVTGDFNGNGLTDIALVNQQAGWTTLPIAFSNGNGSFNITNVNVGDFAQWATQPGVRVLAGDFNGNGRTDIALVNQGSGWATLPVAFSDGKGAFEITNTAVGDFGKWSASNSVQLVTGDFNRNGQTDIALVNQTAGWGSVPVAFSAD